MTGLTEDDGLMSVERSLDKFRNFVDAKLVVHVALALAYGGFTASAYFMPQVAHAIKSLPTPIW
ncbi:MAG: hypothetical protein O3A21_08085 [Proteobacteria bacterium]|nr:hypothetical protein [Pseudomonadota bacterium]